MTVTEYTDSIDTDPGGFLPRNAFYVQVQRGEFTQEQFENLIIAKYRALFAELSAHALLLSRHTHPVPARVFSYTVHWLALSYGRLLEAARALGMALEDHVCPDSRPGPARDWADFLAGVGLNAGPAEAALMIRTDFLTWSATCGALADALRGEDVCPGLIDYLDSEREAPSEIVDGALQVVEYGLSQGEDAEKITQSARRVLEVQQSSWDSISGG